MTPVALLTLPPFTLNPLSLLNGLLSSALSQFVASARTALDSDLQRYLFSTHDVSGAGGGGQFVSTPGLVSLNHLLALATGALLLAVLLYSGLRTVTDAGGERRHQLQVVLPRAMAALALGAFSLPIIQQLIDLNNALCQVVVGGTAVSLSDLPWSSPLSGPAIASASNNIFLLLFAAALVLAVVILALAYVVRYTLLAVLCASAPSPRQRGSFLRQEASPASGGGFWSSRSSCSSCNSWSCESRWRWRSPVGRGSGACCSPSPACT